MRTRRRSTYSSARTFRLPTRWFRSGMSAPWRHRHSPSPSDAGWYCWRSTMSTAWRPPSIGAVNTASARLRSSRAMRSTIILGRWASPRPARSQSHGHVVNHSVDIDYGASSGTLAPCPPELFPDNGHVLRRQRPCRRDDGVQSLLLRIIKIEHRHTFLALQHFQA